LIKIRRACVESRIRTKSGRALEELLNLKRVTSVDLRSVAKVVIHARHRRIRVLRNAAAKINRLCEAHHLKSSKVRRQSGESIPRRKIESIWPRARQIAHRKNSARRRRCQIVV